MSSAFSIDFLEPTSEFLTPVKSVGIHFLSKIARKILATILSVFAEIFTFSTCEEIFSRLKANLVPLPWLPSLMVSVLADIVHYATSSLI